MKLVRFMAHDGQVKTGVLCDANRAWPLKNSPYEVPLSEISTEHTPVRIDYLLPPVDPPNIYGIAHNYVEHISEMSATKPEWPYVFMKPTTTICTPGTFLVLPETAWEKVDYEAELAVVIGKTATNVSVEDARDHILGYTCANDVTARDCQESDEQWVRAKGFDTFCPIGPWIVTADEYDPLRKRITCRHNGEIVQDASTSEMVYSAYELVSYLSRQFTLKPGTVILTGTPAGVGAAQDPPVFLQGGDWIEIEIEGIGALANQVRISKAVYDARSEYLDNLGPGGKDR